jgi:serine/threonine-protein kinase ATR
MAAENGIKSRRPGAKFINKLGEPASSLIAARLAPHATSEASQEHGLSRETFSQLRQEILGCEEGGQLNLDGNISDIHNLVCVVVRAGLEPSLNAPSAAISNEEIQAQILDCLDIVQLAVRRAPQVLYEISDPQILDKDGVHAPLFVWLIPHLLSLICVWNLENIQEKTYALLSTISRAQFKVSRLWHSSRSISSLLQACVSGVWGNILLTFETE